MTNQISNLNSLIPDHNKSGMSAWSPYSLMPELISLLITVIIMFSLIIAYRRRLKKFKPGIAPVGLFLIAELVIKWAESQVVDLMGKKYKYLTVYFLYLLFFLSIGNLLSILGFESFVTSFTVPLSLGIVAFIGIYYFGIKYQRLSFFKKFLNPLELIQQFVPLISISFRLFGNILGGSIIVMLFTSLLGFLWGHIPYLGPVDLLAGVILPFLSIYFDLFDGVIQSYIFAILTIAYWAMEMSHGIEKKPKKRKEIEVVKNVQTREAMVDAYLLKSQK